MIRVLVLLVLLALAGCTGQGVSYDKEVDDLGAHIVADLKGQPEVSDASYKYDHGVDFGQRLRVRAILKPENASDEQVQRTIDLAAKDFWLSPANVGHCVIEVSSAADQDRILGTKNIEDTASGSRPDMDRKYGPRPTRPPR